MRRVLVTSFEPFANRELNISALISEELKGRVGSLPVEFGTLPVTYRSAFPALKTLKERVRPEVLMLLGEALGSLGLRLERYAHNWCFSPTADNEGITLLNKKVHQEGPECLTTSVPLPDLAGSDDSIQVSLSAGAFVCNQVYYLSLLNFSPEVECLFIHVTDKLSIDHQAERINSILHKLTLGD